VINRPTLPHPITIHKDETGEIIGIVYHVAGLLIDNTSLPTGETDLMKNQGAETLTKEL